MTKKIAFQGTFGANSDLACRQFYPDYNGIPCNSFAEVFELVTKEEVKLGIIPLENSYAGRVSEIHNLLQDSNLSIVAEHFFKVEHYLAVLPGTKLDKLKEVYSHPQALMQCKNHLAEMNVKLVNYSNTAQAAEFIKNSNDKSKAAICSKIAAKLNGLEIIADHLEDDYGNNVTTFVTISKKAIDPNPTNGQVITTLLFTVRNIPGALYKVLGGFATNNVNMIKLESYIPGSTSSVQAKFFISIEGHPNQKNVAQALEELGFFSKTVKVLGVYYADKHRY